VGESLTNLVWARIDDLEQVKCSANWMWAPKLPGEGAALRDAAEAMAEAMIAVGMAVDGGKDSLSMATKVDDEVVKSPRQLVISAYAAMSDIRRKVTPDIKEPGSVLLFIDLAGGKNRLGGSALAQTCGRLGSEVPDMDNPALVKRAFLAVQELIDNNLILAGHDRSDGGLITTVLEMAFSGNCGLKLALSGSGTVLETLFAEELGLVVECRWNQLAEVKKRLDQAGTPCAVLGATTVKKAVTIQYNGELVLDDSMVILRQWWEETSYQLERLQVNPDCADAEKINIFDRTGPAYHLSFTPRPRRGDPAADRQAQGGHPPRRGVQLGPGDDLRLLQRRFRALGCDHDRPAERPDRPGRFSRAGRGGRLLLRRRAGERQGLGRDHPLQRAAPGPVPGFLQPAGHLHPGHLQRLPAVRPARLGAVVRHGSGKAAAFHPQPERPLRIPLGHGQGSSQQGDHAPGHGGSGLRHPCRSRRRLPPLSRRGHP
jgi:hypothetical protein